MVFFVVTVLILGFMQSYVVLAGFYSFLEVKGEFLLLAGYLKSLQWEIIPQAFFADF